MRIVTLSCAVLFAWSTAWSQPATEVAAERSRISAERQHAEDRFAAEQRACRARFVVNNCLDEARARRRAALADLRRQETSISDAERRRKAAERVQGHDDRMSPERQLQDSEQRARSAAEQRDRQAAAARKAAERIADEPQRKESAEGRQNDAERRQTSDAALRRRGAARAQEKARQYQERMEDAREAKARVDKRLAERKNTEPRPLPVPP